MHLCIYIYIDAYDLCIHTCAYIYIYIIYISWQEPSSITTGPTSATIHHHPVLPRAWRLQQQKQPNARRNAAPEELRKRTGRSHPAADEHFQGPPC